MAVNSGNGWVKFLIGSQALVWGTCANVYTSDPVDAEGVPLTGGDLAAVTVAAGASVTDDTAYWTFGEGPVPITLVTDIGTAIYAGSPFFRVEGAVISVHPSQSQIEAGLVGAGAGTVTNADIAATAAISGTKLADVHLRNRVTFSNAAAVMASTTRYLAQVGAMGASRAVTLPLANSVAVGTEILIADESGSVTATNSIVATCAGSDRILGTTTMTIDRAYGSLRLVSDGTSKWTPVAQRTLVADADIAANAAISASKLNGVHLRQRGTFSNMAYPIVYTDRYVAQVGTMSASRVATLPLAASVSSGTQITVADESGTVTATNTIVVTRNTADTVNGGTTATIAVPYGSVTLISDGDSKWTTLDARLFAKPASPTAITGVRTGNCCEAVMSKLLAALTAHGLIVDQTSIAATATGTLTLSGTASAEDGT